MYYIFNSENKVVGWCNYEPNQEDLASRQERFIFSEESIKEPFKLVIGKYGTLFEPADNPKTKEELVEEKATTLLYNRNKLLSESDWIINRHFEQKMLNIETSLTELQFETVLSYRQKLRDVTSDPMYPDVTLPALPQGV